MKKQIIYPDFISRIFTNALDLGLVSIPVLWIMRLIAPYLYLYTIPELADPDQNLFTVINDPANLKKLYLNGFILFLINIILAGVYFITCWYKFSATPGKMILRMKIVNESDYTHPVLKVLIKRFFWCLIGFIGLLFILFNKKRQALHDRMVHTLVIKN